MRYEEAKRLMETARNKDKGKPLDKNNTRLYEVNDSAYIHPVYEIRLHRWPIIRLIKFNDGTVYQLSSCGWKTVTTKQRLNHYTPFHVYQKNWDWFLEIIQPIGMTTYEFKNGMELSFNYHTGITNAFFNGKLMEAIE
tara:strand:- start:2932 stop:3345 length:414 start_codon:yes stop_codon:yes gene_type:complete